MCRGDWKENNLGLMEAFTFSCTIFIMLIPYYKMEQQERNSLNIEILGKLVALCHCLKSKNVSKEWKKYTNFYVVWRAWLFSSFLAVMMGIIFIKCGRIHC